MAAKMSEHSPPGGLVILQKIEVKETELADYFLGFLNPKIGCDRQDKCNGARRKRVKEGRIGD